MDPTVTALEAVRATDVHVDVNQRYAAYQAQRAARQAPAEAPVQVAQSPANVAETSEVAPAAVPAPKKDEHRPTVLELMLPPSWPPAYVARARQGWIIPRPEDIIREFQQRTEQQVESAQAS